MRKLKFQMIADSRFDSDLEKTVCTLAYKVHNALQKLEDVTFEHGEIIDLDFPNHAQQIPNHAQQKRITFYVKKHSRKTTWNDIYKAVNSVKPVPYDFV